MKKRHQRHPVASEESTGKQDSKSGRHKKHKKKKNHGCLSFLLLLILFLVIVGAGLFFYVDYDKYQEQQAAFDGMTQAAKEIVVHSSTKETAKESLTTLIDQTKGNTELTNLKAEISYPNQTTVWAAGNRVTVTFSGTLQTKNPFLDTIATSEITESLICDAQSLTMVPTSVTQTGIKGDYTNYNYFYDKWFDDTNQRVIADKWNEDGRIQSQDIATLGGYYLVAVRPVFGGCGDVIRVVLEDGTAFDCIIADEKGDDAGSDWGHIKSGALSLVEFEVIGNTEDDQAPNFVTPEEWEGKKVSCILNKGTASELENILIQ